MPPALLGLAALLVGLVVGSFLNVVIHRLPLMMERAWRAECRELLDGGPPPGEEAPESRYDLVWPGSACPACGHRLAAWENIPVVSYLLLRGRCRGCAAPIAARYPLVEAAAGVLSLVVVLHFGASLEALGGLAVTWTLVALAGIDAERQLLPDALTLPLLWLGLLASLTPAGFVSPPEAIVGAAAGYLVLWAVHHGFRLATGKIGMGHGDFKLMAALGAWLGWAMLPLIVLLGSLVGAVVGIALIALQGRERSRPLAFGPYLAAAGWVAMLWGPAILEWYLGAFGLGL